MNNEQSKIYLTIDQKRVEAKDGMTILQIAQANRIDIPTYCVVRFDTDRGLSGLSGLGNVSERITTLGDSLRYFGD